MIDYGKYIIIENSTGCELAILFDPIIEHSLIASTFKKVISAGFFSISIPFEDVDNNICVFGNSTSLKKEVRIGIDEKLIKRILQGE